MLAQFLTIMNSWVGIPLKSGLFFWLGGLMAWFYHSLNWIAVHHLISGIQPRAASLITPEWQPLWLWLHQDLKPEHTALLLFMLLFIMMLGNAIVSRLTFPVLRLLEGYGWLWTPFRRLVTDLADRYYFVPRTEAFCQLGNPAHLPPDKREYYLRLENEQLYLLPKHDRLPTRLGNILRSHERRPAQKYGLDALVCWQYLWMVMPESAKKDLSIERENLDDSVKIWLWSVLFLLWTVWAWQAVFVSLVLVFATYSRILQAAKTYGKLQEAGFDLYRPLLYQNLRFPLPEDPTTEAAEGEKLTAYLLRGTKEGVQFVTDSQAGAGG